MTQYSVVQNICHGSILVRFDHGLIPLGYRQSYDSVDSRILDLRPDRTNYYQTNGLFTIWLSFTLKHFFGERESLFYFRMFGYESWVLAQGLFNKPDPILHGPIISSFTWDVVKGHKWCLRLVTWRWVFTLIVWLTWNRGFFIASCFLI